VTPNLAAFLTKIQSSSVSICPATPNLDVFNTKNEWFSASISPVTPNLDVFCHQKSVVFRLFPQWPVVSVSIPPATGNLDVFFHQISVILRIYFLGDPKFRCFFHQKSMVFRIHPPTTPNLDVFFHQQISGFPSQSRFDRLRRLVLEIRWFVFYYLQVAKNSSNMTYLICFLRRSCTCTWRTAT